MSEWVVIWDIILVNNRSSHLNNQLHSVVEINCLPSRDLSSGDDELYRRLDLRNLFADNDYANLIVLQSVERGGCSHSDGAVSEEVDASIQTEHGSRIERRPLVRNC
ncbi:hypothetical protein TNIN_478221 [Trichonephila inaurata madagascariensis]|uniref:Uncharacterized protein n=1 Tax=Trichonephila inaurata madagascariensis TaxID=2747483 RepID=A0A8X6WRP1_9ARAC|nr:hypothetical protein TNIN_478221 [Trichonephila inaurata madagascariensis]